MNPIIELFLQNPISQIIGFIALFVSMIAFVSTDDKKFLFFNAVSSVIWALHFYTMGLLAAAIISIFDMGKNLIIARYRKQSVFYCLVVIGGIIGYLSFDSQNLFSLIPAITSVLSIIFLYYLQGIWLKTTFLGILFAWLCYNIAGQSIGGVIGDVILIIATIVGICGIIQQKRCNLHTLK